MIAILLVLQCYQNISESRK